MFCAAINHQLFAFGLCKSGDAQKGLCIQGLAPNLLRHIKRIRLEGLVRGVVGIKIILRLARFIIIFDLLQTLDRCFFAQRVKHDRRIADIIKQRVSIAIEKRQPMFHARMAAAFADRFIKRIAARLAAKLLHIILPKARHGLAGQRDFAHRHQIKPTHLGNGALAFGIKAAD